MHSMIWVRVLGQMMKKRLKDYCSRTILETLWQAIVLCFRRSTSATVLQGGVNNMAVHKELCPSRRPSSRHDDAHLWGITVRPALSISTSRRSWIFTVHWHTTKDSTALRYGHDLEFRTTWVCLFSLVQLRSASTVLASD